ncbi:MAG: hypothetical protein ACTH6I_10370 [Vibrio litoralis]|uniref:hypothetical protein n=1 Tax=Vibrio litoralis TaxID=335972 RepID=UPI003F97AFFB
MGLKVVVIGCEHSQGLSKNGDKPYNFAQVSYLAPNEGWTSQKGSCSAVGLTQKQIAMNPKPELFSAFASMESEFPCMAELILDIDPSNPQRNYVVDIKLIK